MKTLRTFMIISHSVLLRMGNVSEKKVVEENLFYVHYIFIPKILWFMI